MIIFKDQSKDLSMTITKSKIIESIQDKYTGVDRLCKLIPLLLHVKEKTLFVLHFARILNHKETTNIKDQHINLFCNFLINEQNENSDLLITFIKNDKYNR